MWLVYRESKNSLPDKNLDTEAGRPVEIHWVEADVAGVGSQVVFDYSVSISIFIPTEYLREYESDDYLGFTSWDWQPVQLVTPNMSLLRRGTDSAAQLPWFCCPPDKTTR